MLHLYEDGNRYHTAPGVVAGPSTRRITFLHTVPATIIDALSWMEEAPTTEGQVRYRTQRRCRWA